MTAAAAVQSAIAQISACWNAQTRWTVLDTGVGDAHHLLALLPCWRSHALAPHMLHYVGVMSLAQAGQLPTLLRARGEPALADLCYDLEPGFQRLLLERGHVSLTLCVGETFALLDQQQMQADSLLLAGPAQPWDKWQLKALARCCKRGAQLVFDGPLWPAPTLLADAGFQLSATSAGIETGVGSNPMGAVYEPRWQLRSDRNHRAATAGRCAVIGAGIAGASVARALALRGFDVDVYDALAHPAGGTSGLPLGLVVPHHSADDSPRSRMSRRGTRLMLQHAGNLLQAGQDWHRGGVLELSIGGHGLPEVEAEVLSHPAATPTPPHAQTAAQTPSATGWARPMALGDAQGLWHPHAAWIKPALLVQRWLDHPQIHFHGQAAVHTLERLQGPEDHWLLRNAQGEALGRAGRVVFANAHGCVELVGRLAPQLAQEPQPGWTWVTDVLGKLQAMQRLYGTVSHGPCPAPAADAHADAKPANPGQRANARPAFPVNGHGSFASGIPTSQGPQWYAGATFQSDAHLHANLASEHDANFRKLQALLPAAAQELAPAFTAQQVQAWQGSRCISHDRLPLVGPLEASHQPTLWLCAGMGARGLSFSALCAELLVAQLCGEPLPLESPLARALDTRRPRRARARALEET